VPRVNSTSRGAVPVIDIGGLGADPRGHAAVWQIAEAASGSGFFQVVGHGIPGDLIDEVWAMARRFFELPRAQKRSLLRSKENSRGFYDRELTKQKRDLKEVFDFATVRHPELRHDHPDNIAPVDGHNQWPVDLPEMQPLMMRYLAECEAVALRILGAFAVGFGISPGEIQRHFGSDSTSFIRLNHYPLGELLTPDEAAEVTALGDMALHHHTDAGALTLLLQDDVGGLQAGTGDGDWIDVEPIEGAIVVNTGDIMQVWSNDRFTAALHRVRPITDRGRYSIPYFFNPSYTTDYLPIPEAFETGETALYRTINWGVFRQGRADGDFADYGTENQIGDYRVDGLP